jgi:hypothetical protein
MKFSIIITILFLFLYLKILQDVIRYDADFKNRIIFSSGAENVNKVKKRILLFFRLLYLLFNFILIYIYFKL